MYIFLNISFFILFLYIIQISLFTYGFFKLKPFNTKVDIVENKKHLSVIIPFKNEEENLVQLIHNLKNQTLPPEYFEVILINDNSNDKSQEIVNVLIENISNFHLINLAYKNRGKKHAIKEGIKASNTNLIVTSDADCIHQKKWLETILNYYLKKTPKMIIAPVIMTGKTLFQKQQSLEFFSLTASTAGATGINRSIMCNGANLIYEKTIYNEFEDALNMQEVSGDDIFLMHNIKKKYPKDIHYLKSNNAIVYTEAEKSIKSFFKQRIRWASKSKSYNDLDTIVSAVLVFSVNILFILLLFLSFFDTIFFTYLFILGAIKFSVDVFFLTITGKHFKQLPNIILFFFLSLFYPFYIVFTATVSLFIKTIAWKS